MSHTIKLRPTGAAHSGSLDVNGAGARSCAVPAQHYPNGLVPDTVYRVEHATAIHTIPIVTAFYVYRPHADATVADYQHYMAAVCSWVEPLANSLVFWPDATDGLFTVNSRGRVLNPACNAHDALLDHDRAQPLRIMSAQQLRASMRPRANVSEPVRIGNDKERVLSNEQSVPRERPTLPVDPAHAETAVAGDAPMRPKREGARPSEAPAAVVPPPPPSAPAPAGKHSGEHRARVPADADDGPPPQRAKCTSAANAATDVPYPPDAAPSSAMSDVAQVLAERDPVGGGDAILSAQQQQQQQQQQQKQLRKARRAKRRRESKESHTYYAKMMGPMRLPPQPKPKTKLRGTRRESVRGADVYFDVAGDAWVPITLLLTHVVAPHSRDMYRAWITPIVQLYAYAVGEKLKRFSMSGGANQVVEACNLHRFITCAFLWTASNDTSAIKRTRSQAISNYIASDDYSALRKVLRITSALASLPAPHRKNLLTKIASLLPAPDTIEGSDHAPSPLPPATAPIAATTVATASDAPIAGKPIAKRKRAQQSSKRPSKRRASEIPTGATPPHPPQKSPMMNGDSTDDDNDDDGGGSTGRDDGSVTAAHSAIMVQPLHAGVREHTCTVQTEDDLACIPHTIGAATTTGQSTANAARDIPTVPSLDEVQEAGCVGGPLLQPHPLPYMHTTLPDLRQHAGASPLADSPSKWIAPTTTTATTTTAYGNVYQDPLPWVSYQHQQLPLQPAPLLPYQQRPCATCPQEATYRLRDDAEVSHARSGTVWHHMTESPGNVHEVQYNRGLVERFLEAAIATRHTIIVWQCYKDGWIVRGAYRSALLDEIGGPNPPMAHRQAYGFVPVRMPPHQYDHSASRFGGAPECTLDASGAAQQQGRSCPCADCKAQTPCVTPAKMAKRLLADLLLPHTIIHASAAARGPPSMACLGQSFMAAIADNQTHAPSPLLAPATMWLVRACRMWLDAPRRSLSMGAQLLGRLIQLSAMSVKTPFHCHIEMLAQDMQRALNGPTTLPYQDPHAV